MAFENISNLAIMVDNNKREYENKVKLTRLKNNLVIDLTSSPGVNSPSIKTQSKDIFLPHRKLVLDDILLLKTHTNSSVKWVEKRVFLFSDSILITTEKKQKSVTQYVAEEDLIPLTRVKLENVKNNIEDFNEVFILTDSGSRGISRKYLFATKFPEIKEEWIKSIDKEKQENFKNRVAKDTSVNKTIWSSVVSDSHFSDGSKEISAPNENKSFKNWFDSKNKKIKIVKEFNRKLQSEENKSFKLTKLSKNKRKLVLNGSLLLKESKDEKVVWKKMKAYLFSDLLLLIPENKKLKDQNCDIFEDGKVIDLSSVFLENIIEISKKEIFPFTLTEIDSNLEDIYTLSAQDNRSKKLWLKSLENEIEKFVFNTSNPLIHSSTNSRSSNHPWSFNSKLNKSFSKIKSNSMGSNSSSLFDSNTMFQKNNSNSNTPNDSDEE